MKTDEFTRRLIVGLVLTTVATLIAGCALVLVLSRATMQRELIDGLNRAERIAIAFRDCDASIVGARKIVDMYAGDDRVTIAFVGADGTRYTGTPTPGDRVAPEWFQTLIAPKLDGIDIPYGDVGHVRIASRPDGEAESAWASAIGAMLPLGLGLIIGTLTCVGLALRTRHSMTNLACGFRHLTAGDADFRLPERSFPPIDLAENFNAMARRLQETSAANEAMSSMIERVQAEERRELARDLHDEVGPALFAIDVDATSIITLTRSGDVDASELARRASAIKAAVAGAKSHVRVLLAQLRPGEALKLGLEQAVQNLTDFWRTRYPDIRFITSIDTAIRPAKVDLALYGVIREALSNAVSHGQPRTIRISVATSGPEVNLSVVDDGGGGIHFDRGGFGVTGMRERIAVVGGRFDIAQRKDVPGVAVTATMPIRTPHGPKARGAL